MNPGHPHLIQSSEIQNAKDCLPVFSSAQVSAASPRFQVRPPKLVDLLEEPPGPVDEVGEQRAKPEASPPLPSFLPGGVVPGG